MATVFMKWLEQNPQKYARGIRILTFGKHAELLEVIVNKYVLEGMQVLELGCGPGELLIAMAKKGAMVTGIDIDPNMLAIARQRVSEKELSERVYLKQLDITMMSDVFESGSFDLIVSVLAFSELSLDEQQSMLEVCDRMLKPEGKLLLADEFLPNEPFSRFIYNLIRLPIVFVTWVLTRTITHPVKNMDPYENTIGFKSRIVKSYLANTLRLLEIEFPRSKQTTGYLTFNEGRQATAENILPLKQIEAINVKPIRRFFIEFWGLFFRIIPPYPKVEAGLYKIGEPDSDSPVLVTGNFALTVYRLTKAINKKLDAWLLIADSKGINVWCSAGAGYFSAEKIINALRVFEVERYVIHRRLILPQLCANGVNGWKIRRETGWGVFWGPVRAADIPEFVDKHYKKSLHMRTIDFPIINRLEMVLVTLGFYGLVLLIPLFIFWREMFVAIALSLLALSLFYAVVLPWLPGKDGLYKSIPLFIIAFIGLVSFSVVTGHPSGINFFHWSVILCGLSVFTASELQGMSPLMRGEQANWIFEAIIGILLVLLYLIVPVLINGSS